MATFATLTITADDIAGIDFNDRRTSAFIEANTPNSVIIVDGDEFRIGGRRTSPTDGIITFADLVTTDSADNPASFSYRVTFVYTPNGGRKQETFTTGWFPLTASANLAAIPEAWDDITAPVLWRSEFMDQAEALLAQQELVAGLTGEDDAVALLVNTPASDTAVALSATFVPVVRPERYGAVGDGVADDTAELQAALTAAAGGKLVITGTHKIAGTLTPSTAAPTTIEVQQGAAIVQHSNLPHVSYAGSYAASIPVTAGATAQSMQLTVASHTLAVGDYVLVTSDDTIPGVTTAEGMLRKIIATTATTLLLDSTLYVGLPTSPRIHKLTLAPRLTVKGEGEWRQDTPATKSREMFNVSIALEPTWEGVAIRSGGGPGVQVTTVEGGSFSGVVRDLLNFPAVALPSPETTIEHYGYAVNLSGATRGFLVHNGLASNVRHGVTTSGHGPTAGVVDAGRGGPEVCRVARSFRVTGIPGPVNATTSNREISAGLDTHEQGWGNILDGVVDGCLTGITDRARNTVVAGRVSGAMYGALVLSTASGATVDTVVTDRAAAIGGQTPAPFDIRIDSAVTTLGRNVVGTVLYGAAGYAKRAGEVLTIPAARFTGVSGSFPTLQVHGSMVGSYQYGFAASGGAGGVVEVPDEWQEFALYAWVVNPTASTGNVRLSSTTGDLTDGGTVTTSVSTSATITHPAGAINVTQRVLLDDAVACPTKAKTLRVDRIAADATDTLEDNYRLLAVELVRTR